LYETLAYYAERVLQGMNPRDLPIEQATKIDLVVNATVARSLGIAIPQSVLVQANVIVR
jgi:putative ABC transport system substrate-binding protein